MLIRDVMITSCYVLALSVVTAELFTWSGYHSPRPHLKKLPSTKGRIRLFPDHSCPSRIPKILQLLFRPTGHDSCSGRLWPGSGVQTGQPRQKEKVRRWFSNLYLQAKGCLIFQDSTNHRGPYSAPRQEEKHLNLIVCL